MPTINDAYINALLSDATYVNSLTPGLNGNLLEGYLEDRMTPDLAKYISDNFTVITQERADSSFDATVWRGNAGTAYAGQVYVSMRGTQELPDDFTTDGDLAVTGLAHEQLMDMVNWWLRETTPSTLMAPQITIETLSIPGSSVSLRNFVAAPFVQGGGEVSGC